MLDDNIIRIAEERLLLEFGEQDKNLNQEISRIKASMAAHGSLQSSTTIGLIMDSCSIAIKNRAQLIWQTLFRFLTTTGISYSENLAEELKALVSKHLPVNLFKHLVEENAKLAGLRGAFQQLGVELDSARRVALGKVGTEIDL